MNDSATRRFSLTIECDSDYFVTMGEDHAVAAILRSVADKLEHEYTEGNIADGNGNHCGAWSLYTPMRKNARSRELRG